MILLTVGTQLPFDRLVHLMDEIAGELQLTATAQIGQGKYEPANMAWRRMIDPVEFEGLFAAASLIVSHAGIGSVVMAQRHCKPLIIFPRLSTLNEHRNNHQVATMRSLQGRQGIYCAESREELVTWLQSPLLPLERGADEAGRSQLCTAIRTFIEDERTRRIARRPLPQPASRR